MQVFKKISVIFTVLILAGCTTAGTTPREGQVNIIEGSNIDAANFGSAANFRVGMLLPLTGMAAKQGQGLRNAALMALEDVKNPNMMLQFYDTKSTPSGARAAVENAINQRSQLIIGPLMADEVRAISDRVLSKDIPVITFSTNNDVLQPGIYSLGLLIGDQVDRMVTYAAYQGRKKIALIVPDNNTGIAVSRAAIISAQKNGVVVTSIAFYPPETTDFSKSLKEFTNYDRRSARAHGARSSLSAKAAKGDTDARKALSRLRSVDTLGDVDFDTIIIPEYGTRLQSAVAMLGYYDVSAPKVQIIGTSIWENSSLNRESSLIGAWYPALSRSHSGYFVNKYTSLFKEAPNSIYAFGYDAVALASALSRDPRDLPSAISHPDGYVGINGVFRIFNNGGNQHSLDIYEVRRNGNFIVENAPKALPSNNYIDLREVKINDNFTAPRIYGKDTSLAQSLIFGQQLNPENQPRYNSFESDGEIARESLAKHKIIIPE